MAGNQGGYTRVLTGEILEDNGDGTFLVDIDGDGVGVTVARAPVVQVGQPGTVLDLDGAQVLIGPRAGDDQPGDALSGLGSFETWRVLFPTTSGQTPAGWQLLYGLTIPPQCAPYTAWTADGVFSAAIGVPAVVNGSTMLTTENALIAPAPSYNLKVTGTYKPLVSQAGNRVRVRVWWGTTDAGASPVSFGLKTTVVDTVLPAGTDEVSWEVTAPMPVGAYIYARLALEVVGKAASPVAGDVAFDGVRASWLESGRADTPWLPWTPVLSAATTNPNIGTAGSGATALGRYTRNGTTVVGWGSIDAGTSGVAVGSGVYGFSLPVAPQAESNIVVPFIIGVSATDIRGGFGRQVVGSPTINRMYVADPAGYAAGVMTTVAHVRLQVNNSGAWFLRWSFAYEAALPAPV